MHVVFDAFSVRAGSSAVILEGLLRGWRQAYPEDQLTVVAAAAPEFGIADGVDVRLMDAPVSGKPAGLWFRTIGVRKAVRDLKADLLVSGVTASAFLGSPCPRGVILTDLRHELRPDQFSSKTRAARAVAYGWSYSFADGIYCISERTRDDVVRLHPRTAGKAVAARLGADHVDAWPARTPDVKPYALAFGHFANKNVDAVLDAWAEFAATDPEWTLRLIGMGRADREAATLRVAELGITERVELMPWLDDAEFMQCFVDASLVVFPSEFEGYGLPPVEAMRLGIPVVISADPALLEMSGGHTEVARDLSPALLAGSIRKAIARTPDELAAARTHTDSLSWRGMAETVRRSLLRQG